MLIFPQVSASGDLVFQFKDTANASITFDLFARDSGGTDNGGVDQFGTQSVELLLMNDLIFRDGFE